MQSKDTPHKAIADHLNMLPQIPPASQRKHLRYLPAQRVLCLKRAVSVPLTATVQELKEKTCCFTGHQNIPEKDVDQILDRAKTLVRALVEKGVRYFGAGGAFGFDTLVAQHLFWLRDIDQGHFSLSV